MDDGYDTYVRFKTIIELIENKELAPEINAYFEFDEKELAFLMNTKPTTKKVKKIIDESKEIKTGSRL